MGVSCIFLALTMGLLATELLAFPARSRGGRLMRVSSRVDTSPGRNFHSTRTSLPSATLMRRRPIKRRYLRTNVGITKPTGSKTHPGSVVVQQTVVLAKNANIIRDITNPTTNRNSRQRSRLVPRRPQMQPFQSRIRNFPLIPRQSYQLASNHLANGPSITEKSNKQHISNSNHASRKSNAVTKIVLMPDQEGQRAVVIHSTGGVNVSKQRLPDGQTKYIISNSNIAHKARKTTTTTLKPGEDPPEVETPK